jgi:hypothetical protein
MRNPGEVVGIIFVVVMGVIAVVSILMRHLRGRREMLHEERLKYLERGLTPPDTDRGPSDRERVLHNSFWISFWTGGVVPVVAVIAGAITTSEMRHSYDNTEAMFFLWGGVVAICLAGVASAATIMVSTNRRPDDRGQIPGDTRGYHSPPVGTG